MISELCYLTAAVTTFYNPDFVLLLCPRT